MVRMDMRPLAGQPTAAHAAHQQHDQEPDKHGRISQLTIRPEEVGSRRHRFAVVVRPADSASLVMRPP